LLFFFFNLKKKNNKEVAEAPPAQPCLLSSPPVILLAKVAFFNSLALLPPALLPLARASLEAGAMLRCEKEAFLFFISCLLRLPLLRRGGAKEACLFEAIFININKNNNKNEARAKVKCYAKNCYLFKLEAEVPCYAEEDLQLFFVLISLALLPPVILFF
jgi:hypothetical protein